MAELGYNTDIDNFFEGTGAEEIDGFRNTLATILMENTDLDADTIYELVFNKGRNIVWC